MMVLAGWQPVITCVVLQELKHSCETVWDAESCTLCDMGPTSTCSHQEQTCAEPPPFYPVIVKRRPELRSEDRSEAPSDMQEPT